ncbi:helix-turn-helix transcriptional regulator [Ruania zhangjianzhongii]|uniref:helix-turn-helix transcriptional regulator n=1 Tax=Ruania zhangjianzhongii TaxID=2603206 RepID=UPI0011CC9B3D|nr:helix-turn-helix transcriptional regulator [Ruania zhangjianzhongii]
MAEVSATAGALLGLLAERPMTGWELVAEARSRVGSFWTIQRSQVYRELAALQKGGLAESLPPEARGRRRYRITSDGRAAYHAWVQSMPGEENVRIPFLLSVAFAGDIPTDRFAELVADQRRRHAQQLQQYQALHEQLSTDTSPVGRSRLATLALGIEYERAALTWLADLPSYLDQPTDS